MTVSWTSWIIYIRRSIPIRYLQQFGKLVEHKSITNHHFHIQSRHFELGLRLYVLIHRFRFMVFTLLGNLIMMVSWPKHILRNLKKTIHMSIYRNIKDYIGIYIYIYGFIYSFILIINLHYLYINSIWKVYESCITHI